MRRPSTSCNGPRGSSCRNGWITRPNSCDSRPRGGSMVWGNADSSCSLLAMSDPSFWLSAGRRVREGIQGRPVGCWYRRLQSLAFEPAGLDLAGERLAFVHAHVRVGQERGQLVGVAADNLPGESPVEREADLVDYAPLDDKGPQAPGHHRTGLDSTARRLDRHPAAVNNTALGGQLVAQLGEHLRLQFVEPAVEAAHRATQVMLGETERCGHHGVLGGRRVGYVVERSFEEAYRWVVVVFGIEQVAQGGLNRLVMRGQRPVLDAWGVEPTQAVGLRDEGLG